MMKHAWDPALWSRNTKVAVLHPDDVSFQLLVFIFPFFVAFVVTVTENTSFLSQKLCNIHTVSPFNCTQKIKKIFLSKLKKYKFRKGKGYEKISQIKKPLEAARPLQQKSAAESGATFVTLVKW